MAVRFSCSSFCCSGVIAVLFGTKNETVVVEQGQGISSQLVTQRILKAQRRRLYLAARLLLAKDGGDVVGAECAGGMVFAESGSHGLRSILPNQSKAATFLRPLLIRQKLSEIWWT
jgi:hypothetical protein